MQYFDAATQIERVYMDSHTEDWFVSDDDIELLSIYEYVCWHDDCFDDFLKDS